MLFRRRATAGTLTRSLMVAEVEAGGAAGVQLHFCIPAWLCWTARCPIRTGETAAPHGRRPHRRVFFSCFALLKIRHTRNPYRLPTTTKVSGLDTGHV